MSKTATDYDYRIVKVSEGFISTDWLNHNLLSFTCCREYFNWKGKKTHLSSI